MKPHDALEAVRLSGLESEARCLQTEIRVARSSVRKAVKVRGILEACLRDILALDPRHKSAIECAWQEAARVDDN